MIISLERLNVKYAIIKKSYEIIKELPYEYIGQLDFMAFLLMYIYYNSAWKGFMEIINEN